MFTLKIENRFGETLTLWQSKNYVVTDIDGLDPPKGKINYSDVVGMAGGLYNSSSIEVRNIVLTVQPLDPVEKNRLNLYRYFQSGEWCKIYYSNGSVDVQIEGYVETIEAPLFTKSQTIQISIICPQPYFEGLFEIYNDISSIVSAFEFPFAIEKEGIEFSFYNRAMLAYVTNYGDVDTGVLIYLTARGTVINPTIYNNETRGSISLNLTMQEFDQVVINTKSGARSVTLLRNNRETNIMNTLGKAPEWFTLKPGENIFSYTADQGEDLLGIVFRHRTMYGGV